MPLCFYKCHYELKVKSNVQYENVMFFHKEPASEVFEVTSAGAVRLKKRLNYNSVQKYNFTVRASVSKSKSIDTDRNNVNDMTT